MGIENTTGKSGPDFTDYKEILKEGIAENRKVASQLIPRLCKELTQKQGLSPVEAAKRILDDCVPTWCYGHIMQLLKEELPTIAGEAQLINQSKVPGGKARATAAARKKEEIIRIIRLTQKQLMVCNNASIASTDPEHSIHLFVNAKLEVLEVKPAKEEPVTMKTLPVKTSAAPISLST